MQRKIREEKELGTGGRLFNFVGFCLPVTTLGLCLLPNFALAGSTPDANALVRKMIATYQAAKTIQESSEVNMTIPGAGLYFQTNAIKYKQPYFLALESTDPNTGTVAIYDNGSTVTVYSGKQNVYTKRTAPKNYAQTVALAEKVTIELGVPSGQVVNPVSFLSAKGMPVEAASFRYLGTASVEGHPTYKVIGQGTTAFMQKVAPTKNLTPEKRDIILYIDKRTNLLIRSELTLTWSAPTYQKGKPAGKLMTGYHYEETHRGITLNAPIADKEFVFNPPKGAKEIFQEAR